MTITFKGEIAGSRQATNSEGSRSYTRAFRLITDSKTDGPYEIGSDVNLPVIGSTYPSDGQAYCNNISIVNSDPWQGWTATYQYSDKRELDEDDPEQDETKISFTGEVYQLPAFRDKDEKAVMNSAGDYFLDPPVTMDDSHLIAKFKTNVKLLPIWVLSYQNAVNSGPITISGLKVAKGLAKMTRLEVSERQKRGNITFFTVSYELHIKKKGHRLEVLDAGLRQRNASGGLEDILNDPPGDVEPVTQPVPLDGQGKVITNPTPANSQYRYFYLYPELDFTVLPGVS